MEQLLYVAPHAERVSAMDKILHLQTLPEGAAPGHTVSNAIYLVIHIKV